MRNGKPIEAYPLSSKDKLNVGITYTQSYEEWDACTSLGLDIYKWEQGDYNPAFKMKALWFYRFRNLIKAHIDDEQARQQESKMRRRGRRT